ncbi:MAG TPA: hypothetical protein VGG35_28255 [Streptosporangiaceae bacterium]|jgi:hypothetical protein
MARDQRLPFQVTSSAGEPAAVHDPRAHDTLVSCMFRVTAMPKRGGEIARQDRPFHRSAKARVRN